jgi:hypothetical protein
MRRQAATRDLALTIATAARLAAFLDEMGKVDFLVVRGLLIVVRRQ